MGFAILAICLPPADAASQQCKNPLFMTHWAGKNDIQALTGFPVVKTNLRLCPAYNQRAACCHQTFESEQQKFFNTWENKLKEMLLRMDKHRQAVDAVAASMMNSSGLSETDYGQYQAVRARYSDVLNGPLGAQCFSTLLTYAAGAVCFSCKPDWAHYTVIEGTDSDSWLQHVSRIRIAPSVCLDLWAMCRPWSKAARALRAALRDSVVARISPLAEENLDYFEDQQTLCDWMHDEVAMHPFRLPFKEDVDLPIPPEAASNASSQTSRRLQEVKLELDAITDGQASGFDQTWHDPFQTGYAVPSSRFATAAWVLAASIGYSI